jgi:hypothetical protein
MTTLIRIHDKHYPADIKADNPSTSFPKIIPKETLAAFGYAVVFPTPHTDDQIEGAPQLTSKGHWEQTWHS